MKISSKIILLLSAVLLLNCGKSLQETGKVNILIILVDDLGYHDLGCMGSEYYETPNIDRIAEQGVLFTHGYSASRVCSPSRASLITGKLVAGHGITDYIGAKTGTEWVEFGKRTGRHTKLIPPDYTHELGSEHITVAEAMKSEGYTTFYAGKWHLGGEGSYPEDHGFDINIGGYHAGYPHGGFFSPYKNPKLKDGSNGENLSLRLAEETVKFIEENKDTNFFAMLSFYAVHSPIQTTKDKWEKFRLKAVERGIQDTSFYMERRFPIRSTQDNPVYAGLVETVDDAVGKVITILKELDLYENTLIIFTSDNGGVASGDNYSTSILPLRGGKGYQWEGGIRVPFIIKTPHSLKSSDVLNSPVIHTDIFPTILDYAGLNLMPEHHKEGISLKPLIEGDEIKDRTLFWHYPHYGNQGGDPSSIARSQNWKLIHYWETDTDELYHLENEMDNVILDYPEKAAELEQKLLSWLEQTNAKMPSLNEEYDQSVADSLFNFRKTVLKDRLERHRSEMFNENWAPNENWWGSQISGKLLQEHKNE
jgi:arylsulfatase A-like enzyme